jgi:hypothetical protein
VTAEIACEVYGSGYRGLAPAPPDLHPLPSSRVSTLMLASVARVAIKLQDISSDYCLFSLD